MVKIFRGRVLNPISSTRIEEYTDGYIAVNDDGEITAVGRFDPKKIKGDVKHFKDCAIIPGLIDCHLHMPQLDQRGKHGSTLLDWLKKYIYPAERAFADPAVAEDIAKRFFKKLILNGTTTSMVYTTVHAHSTDLAFEIAGETGLRVIIGKVMMDRNSPPELKETTRRSLDDSVKLYEKWHGTKGGKLMYAFTPRFAPTCSEEMWKGLGELMQKTKAYLQTHLSETVGEVAVVKKMFPKYKDYTGLYEKTGCLTPRTLLAHTIYVSDSECSRIAASKAKVVHCPSSNFFLKSGRMPVELIEKARITYALGTDIGAGTSMSLFTCMRHADYIQPQVSITPAKAFYLATLGGAKVLSLDSSIGNFTVGKKADFCVVDIKAIDPRYNMDELDCGELLSLLMYRGGGRVIKHTYVDGESLDVDMKCLTL